MIHMENHSKYTGQVLWVKLATSVFIPFVPNAPFLYLLKTSENRKFF